MHLSQQPECSNRFAIHDRIRRRLRCRKKRPITQGTACRCFLRTRATAVRTESRRHHFEDERLVSGGFPSVLQARIRAIAESACRIKPSQVRRNRSVFSKRRVVCLPSFRPVLIPRSSRILAIAYAIPIRGSESDGRSRIKIVSEDRRAERGFETKFKAVELLAGRRPVARGWAAAAPGALEQVHECHTEEFTSRAISLLPAVHAAL